MHSSALSLGRLPRPVLALALVAALFGTACSGGDAGAGAKQPAVPPSGSSTAHTATPAKSVEATAPSAKPAEAAKAPAAGSAAALIAAETKKTVIGDKDAPGHVGDADHAGHDHSGQDGHDHDHATPPAALAASTAKPDLKSAGQGQAKPEDLAAKKLADPSIDEVDVNSKAKLTYEFGTETKSFGKCMQGDVLTHIFELQSSGEEDLVIKQAKPTCGCTLAHLAVQQADGTMAPYNFGAPIPPGRKIELAATLHTQNKRGHAASRINIFSNDPRGQSQLGLEADVDPYFQVNPANLNFNQISARDSASDKVTISTTTGVAVKLSAPTENMPQGLSFEVKPIDPDAEGKSARWEVQVKLGPGLLEGNLAYTVGIKSDIEIPGGEKLPSGAPPVYEVSMPVMARVTGMISYTPAFVSLGLIRPGQVVSRSVRITSHDPDFKIPEPKVIVSGRGGADWEFTDRFSTVIRPVAGENSVDVELRLDGMPDTLNGSFTGELTIQIGHPEKPEIKLPITGVCRGAPASSGGADSGG